ncbi:hypothetical protein EV294_109122 [Paenibacillus sp. BK033]|uniref:hypothetical protein n=2 Tax=unclassified Paenibacillus TaxID=185978 RepID=UPI0010490DA7|nr:hypothetical protein [Paenibacillus sp. BK033]TCM91045.1 hypothetical protein EV294_109122 [Paenibacillus sp. BK033]
MKKLLFAVLLFVTMNLAACQDKEVTEVPAEPDLILHLSKSEGKDYTLYKKIEDKETVTMVMDLLSQTDWENAEVSMSRQPDYKIRTINKDPTVSYEQATYAIWLSPKKDRLEAVIEGQSKYGKMTRENTVKLLPILESP